jgi:hypothetical protein
MSRGWTAHSCVPTWLFRHNLVTHFVELCSSVLFLFWLQPIPLFLCVRVSSPRAVFITCLLRNLRRSTNWWNYLMSNYVYNRTTVTFILSFYSLVIYGSLTAERWGMNPITNGDWVTISKEAALYCMNMGSQHLSVDTWENHKISKPCSSRRAISLQQRGCDLL